METSTQLDFSRRRTVLNSTKLSVDFSELIEERAQEDIPLAG